jgi:hypothetical protein
MSNWDPILLITNPPAPAVFELTKKEAVMATRVPHPLHGCGSKLLPSVMVVGRVFSLKASFILPDGGGE